MTSAATRPDETFVLDIDNAMEATRQGRDLPSLERRTAGLRVTCAHQAAMAAFARLNNWQETEQHLYSLDLLGRSAMSSSLRRRNSYDFPLLDHDAWFRRDRRYVAVVGQPYLSAVDLAAQRARLTERGFVLHVPPDPFASFNYPGWCLFLVITIPGVVVNWLPEQDGRLKGRWRDWANASLDYRAAAAAALMGART
jgi:hypothetical protein